MKVSGLVLAAAACCLLPLAEGTYVAALQARTATPYGSTIRTQ